MQVRLAPALLIGILTAAPVAFPARAAPDPSDPRLDARITLRRPKNSLAAAVAAIAGHTGVALRVEDNAGEEPMVLFASDRPAREVMAQLAATFDGRWTASGSRDRRSYLLRRDAASLRREAELRERDRRAALGALIESLEGEIERARTGGDRPRQALLELARRLTPAQRTVLSDGTLFFAARPLAGTLMLPADLAEELAPPGGAPGARPPSVRVAIWLEIEAAPSHLTANLNARAFWADAGNQGQRPEALVMGIHRRPAREPPGAEQVAAWRESLLLGRPVTYRPSPRNSRPRLHELLTAIVSGDGIDLVADAYREQPHPPATPGTSTTVPLSEFLQRHAWPVADWTEDRGFLRVRSRTWFWDRLAEIPDAQSASWADRLRSDGRLSLEEAGRIALALRDEQIERLEAVLRDRGVGFGDAFTFSALLSAGGREILRAYACLSSASRQRLLSTEGIDVRAMPAPARAWLQKARERKARLVPAAWPPAGPAQGRLVLTMGSLRFERRSEDPETAFSRDSGRSFQQATFRLLGAHGEVSSFTLTLPAVHAEPGVTGVYR